MSESNVTIRHIVKSDMLDVVKLLQEISEYKPLYKPLTRKFDEIWKNLNMQELS